jgi:hypothetical protein
MRKIVCDKCLRSDLAPLRPERFAVKVELPGGHYAIDLCEKCAARLKAWISTPDEQAAAA